MTRINSLTSRHVQQSGQFLLQAIELAGGDAANQLTRGDAASRNVMDRARRAPGGTVASSQAGKVWQGATQLNRNRFVNDLVMMGHKTPAQLALEAEVRDVFS